MLKIPLQTMPLPLVAPPKATQKQGPVRPPLLPPHHLLPPPLITNATANANTIVNVMMIGTATLTVNASATTLGIVDARVTIIAAVIKGDTTIVTALTVTPNAAGQATINLVGEIIWTAIDQI